jgi:hypothetical protein
MLPFQHHGNYFHVDVRMNAKAFAGLHKIIVKRKQRSKGRLAGL